ncbi:hypothetical protein BS11774_01090 [Bacillus subtilis]|uniref:hypothetical protein n=1 Tax=Bacillus subtilis TaxID=1423 RepID=UPI000FF8F67B|nr:hypothetical protein [Bacillus subtilis]MEC2401695.1 hypothetical protein [Bacillus subtilis]MED4660143.1 hypothetical protein [Bacillus subtilis]MED4664448.1 hypothetical protein [Bacillus subtilis]QAR59215.1 hypothetical protein BS11774_01090 [Bacillus subtilis]WEZ27417.1 hypothetical protein P5635_15050 [Bacillus subtilis]
MLQVYRYDENYMFIEPILVTEIDEKGDYIIPADCTTVELPDSPSLFKPKFDTENQEWTETATQEEIEAILNSGGKEISAIDLLKQQNASLSLQVAKSEKENEERRMREAEQALVIAQMQKQIEELKGAN